MSALEIKNFIYRMSYSLDLAARDEDSKSFISSLIRIVIFMDFEQPYARE